MKIRKVTQTDNFEAISRIYTLSWKSAYQNIVPKEYLDELAENQWTAFLKNSSYDHFIAVESGEYIGTSSICAARDITMISLLSKGYFQVYLWVLEQNIYAREFYEKAGFITLDRAVINIGGRDLSEIRYIAVIE